MLSAPRSSTGEGQLWAVEPLLVGSGRTTEYGPVADFRASSKPTFNRAGTDERRQRPESAGMFLGTAARLTLLSGEELMKELNGDGAFTDR